MSETSLKPAFGWPNWIQDGHTGVWLRLRYLLENSHGFSLIIVICENRDYQQKLIAQLAQEYGHQHSIDVAKHELNLMENLYQLAHQQGAIHLTETQHWFKDNQHQDAARQINYQREKIATHITVPLLLWLHDTQVNAFAHAAPDAWAWRTAVLDFSVVATQQEKIHSVAIPLSSDKDKAARNQRVEEISAYLDAKSEHSVADISLLLEQSELLQGLGTLDKAMQSAESALALSCRLDDKRHAAMAHGHIANILEARGNLDEALRIWQEEVLPVYEQIGDVRSLLVGRVNLAVSLVEIDTPTHQQKIKELLTWAYIAATSMQLPEADQIAGIMQQVGIAVPKSSVVQAMLENFSLALET